ncbi:ankyrin repeats (3 copies) domain-containing protein [Hirsutella rhossiliensis]|uniref:Ankyrin repeats (3 copies) domain-containing protein n=1 Tax=Hirsutella rhossiliensis TaxID=111463 RepID=A0A9P8SF67_9HYPO|nr:ankyrin repeats (3 copies) domain-containing protein [Hirsutella rhossiliensis]KAH0959120.1 ankyrin repeats (3 copies) domain-containing protein [Hirsutella rhossiliensis]
MSFSFYWAVKLLLGTVDRADQTWDMTDSDSQPALFYAAANHHPGVAKLLKNAGANMEAKKYGQTLLHQMASIGDTEAARILVELDANKEARDNSGRTPLYVAAQAGQRDTFNMLREKGAEKDAQEEKTGRTLLHQAAYDGSVTATRFLIEAGANMGLEDRHGQTPLLFAAKCDQRQIAALLFSDKADKKSPDDKKQILHRAAREGHSIAVGILCEIGFDKEARDGERRTPLYVAAEHGHQDAFRVLVANGADGRAPDAEHGGETLLHRAARENNVHAADLLFLEEDVCNVQDSEGRTPLHVAVTRSLGVVQKLLKVEADIDIADARGQTPLHAAAIRGNVDILTALVDDDNCQGVKDKRDNQGQTALHVAAECGNVDAVQVLIDEGLELISRDIDGRTPLHMAAERGRVRVIRWLLAAGAHKDARDNKGRCPLLLAAMSGNDEAIKLLTNPGDLEVPTPQTRDEYVLALRKYAKDELGGVLVANDKRIKEVARNSAAIVPRISKSCNLSGHEGADLAKLMLYDIVILCDDSKSMHNDCAISMDMDDSGISVRFLNYENDDGGDFDRLKDVGIVQGKVDKVFKVKRDGSQLGTKLKEKVVKPMVEDKFAVGEFRKPLIAVMITDGETTENPDTLPGHLRDCRKFLDDNQIKKGSVLFILSRVGDDEKAARYIQSIEGKGETRDLVYCSQGRLEDMLDAADLKGRKAPHRYAVQLVRLFLNALPRKDAEKASSSKPSHPS